MTDTLAALAALGVVPVVVVDDPANAQPLADALVAGGLPTAEVTLRTPQAVDVIRELAQHGGILVGAGTVVSTTQVEQVVAAGAQYVVSPGFSVSISHACRDAGVPLIPGAVTATEIQAALEAGHDLVKFFPAAAQGGLPTVKALSAPFPQVRFVPTGGIDAQSLRDYLRFPAIAAVGGTWIAPRDLIVAGNFEEIAARARAATQAVVEER
jgi:2-dehydro-3-deoxyphosphogluconate aldolase/(4S)-4-hydroxy-2-oxoglutarate aldolase